MKGPLTQADPFASPWSWVAAGVIVLVALGLLDPELLLVAAVVGGAILLAQGYRNGRWHPPWEPAVVEVIRVRCASCRALHGEEARFCPSCGKPV